MQTSITQSLAGIDAKMQDTARKTGQAAGDTTTQLQKVAGAYSATGAAAKKAGDDVRAATQGFDLMGASLRKLVTTATALVGGISLAALAKSALDTAATFETLDIRLRFLTESVAAFNQAKQFILDFARTTPLQLDEVSNAFVRLTASGFDAATMIPTLVDAVSFFGGSNEQLQSLVVNFQQMATQAKVSGQELRDISRSTMIPAFQLVAEEARKMGIEISDSAAEAGISGMQAIELFMKAAEERFKGATLIMSTTWDVLVSNLVDQWKIFADTVIRESRFLDFMKAAALELFETMDRSITANKAQFVSWGDTVIASMRKAALSVAALLDLLNGVLSLGARVQAQFAEWERQGTETMANLYNSVAEFFGFTGSFTAKVQADIAQATGAVVSGILSNDITNAVNQTFDRLQQRAAELRKVQEEIRGTKPPPPATPPPEGPSQADRSRALREAAQSAVERAKAVEDVLKTSLQRQEAMIEASADQQRQAVFEATRTDLRTQGPGAVEAIAARQGQELQRIATETAAKLETLRLGALEKQTQAREATLRAEIAASGKNLSAKVAAEEELTHLVEESEKQRAIITGKRAETEQNTSEQIAKAQIAHAREVNKILREMDDERLQGRIALVDDQIALIDAQVTGEVLTTQQGIEQIQALERQRFDDQREQVARATQVQVDAVNRMVQVTAEGSIERTQAEERWVREVERIHQGTLTALEALEIKQQTQAQVHRNDLLEGWREWAKDVQSALGNVLVDLFERQITSISSLFDRLKSYFFRVVSEMIAFAATHQIILPIVSSVVGGFGGTVGAAAGAVAGVSSPGGGGGLLQTGLGVLGLGNQVNSLFGQSSPISGAMSFLTDKVWGAINGFDAMLAGQEALTTAMETAALGDLSFVTGGAIEAPAAAAAGLSPTLGALGGLAALGVGIYKALNATNTASKAAYAASAAAGAAALASTALVAAGVIAATSGWTGIGLIAAGVTAILGTIGEMLMKPAGPALAVGQVSGLGIGVEGGQLAVSGDLGSRVLRRDKVDPGVAAGVQAQMEEGLTNAVMSMVQTINAVALDPAALLGPTQDALRRALENIRPINSANAKKMEQDITEQLRFVNVQIVGGMLGPLNRAFDQLRDQGDLSEQLDRLPATTAGLVDVFRNMNTQLGEIAGSKNTDVLRQLSGVRSQVELFGARMAETAGQVAERVVDGILNAMRATVVPTLAGQISQFAGLMDASFRALGSLRATQQSLEGAGLSGGGVGGQIDRLTATMSLQAERISTEIVSGALRNLSGQLDTVLIQPIRVQATTVNSLFTDSLAALNSLWVEWHRLEAQGIDAGRVQQQFDRLVGGVLNSVQRITEAAFDPANFAGFLGVLLSIPEAVAKLNPVTAAVREMGVVFSQVALPIQQVIDATLVDLQAPAERAEATAARMMELRDAIADAGTAIDQALPLYAEMSQAIQASAAAQIEAVNEQADAQREAINSAVEVHQAAIDAWAEAATAAVDAWAEAQMATLDRWVEDSTNAWNTWADTELSILDTWVEDSTKAWNGWADRMMAELDAWVEASTMMLNDWVKAAETTGSQLAGVNATLLGELSPAQQRTELEAQKATLEAVVNATGSPAALSALIEVNQQLLALAKQTPDLALQRDSIDELRAIQLYLRNQLVELTGQSDPVLAQIVVAKIQEQWLKDIASSQKAQGDYIRTTQAAQLEAIAARQEMQRTSIATMQEAQLEAIATRQETQQAEIAASQEAQREAIMVRQKAETDDLQRSQEIQLNTVADWQERTVRAIKVDMVYQLELIQYELQRMFAMQYRVLTGADLGQPTAPVQPASYAPPGLIAAQLGGWLDQASMNRQRTGPLAFAMGGMVPTRLEPGEHVFSSPMSHAQQGALVSMNNAFPRFANGGFTVPGSGSGDRVPALVPSGSFILNKRASGVLGYQSGGSVPSQGATMPPIVIDLRGSVFSSPDDARKVKQILERDVISIVESYYRKTRVQTRLD